MDPRSWGDKRLDEWTDRHLLDICLLYTSIMADFSGRADREAPTDLFDLASRPLLPVDVDHFDPVMARFSPKLSLPLGVNDATLTIPFGQLDDFHPDALYQRLELFQALRRSRASLLLSLIHI